MLVFIFKTILQTNNNIINSIPFPDILFVSTDFNLFDLVKKIMHYIKLELSDIVIID